MADRPGGVLLLFGRGKIPELMGDVAKGIKNFKKGMGDDEVASADKSIDARPSTTNLTKSADGRRLTGLGATSTR